MSWLGSLGARALHRGLGRHGGDGADARVNILGASLDEADRARDLPPPPVAGWRYEGGAWLRWSELDGAYREAPIPMSLVTYAEAVGTPSEGLTVALVDGEWREVGSGAEPLHVRGGEPIRDARRSHARAVEPQGPAVPGRQPVAPGAEVVPATSTADVAPDPAQERAAAQMSVTEQLAAWRRRKGGPHT